MSANDMAEVALAGQQVLDLWLEIFTNSQKVMIGSTLNAEAKRYFNRFFQVKAIFHPKSTAPLWVSGLDSRSCIGKL